MSETTKPVVLERAKRNFHDNIEVLREKAKNKYRELSEEEKNLKREYGRNRYHNMCKEMKEELKEYQRNYRETKKLKNQHNFFIVFFSLYKNEKRVGLQ